MDDVTALRDALLEAIDEAYCPPSAGGTEGIWCLNHDRPMLQRSGDCEMVAHWREVAAVEARAALTPERLAAALVATTIFAGHAHDCPVWMNRMIELRGERVDLDTCTCWVKDEAPDRARRILAALPRPEEPRVERCAVCGVGRWVTAHDPEAGSRYHPFAAEAR